VGGSRGRGRTPGTQAPGRAPAWSGEKEARPQPVDLSAREREILKLMAQGLFNHEIAGHLFLAGETVKTHVHHVLRKLGARTRTHAVAIALQDGLLEDSRPPARPQPHAGTRVPFVDLAPTHTEISGTIVGDIVGLIQTGAFTNGPQVRQFEAAFAAYCGSTDSVGVASGLDALRLALLAGGIEPGDQVIVPAFTFAATIEAVLQAGGKPVLVDVGERDYTLDPAAVEDAVGPRTRFILPVHLYGQMADLVALGRTAERHGLSIVEDACQAHGASRDGRRAGAGGLAGAFSFYPSKNLGAFGDAGAVVTNDQELAARVRALREHGQRRMYVHDVPGYTARLDAIQAVALLRKLPLLEDWNRQREAAARYYQQYLTGVGDLRLPPVPARSEPVWHLYVVRTREPERLAAFLGKRGISTGRHYPYPVHRVPAFRQLGHRQGAFPVSERLASEVLSLPMFPGIREEQMHAVITSITDYFDVE
jgi:dTDP-4-amino-4,6-dideoxygalactose transaminase/DNA-binding CsgD family transcriptional regulator